LEIDPDHQGALTTLILSITDTFCSGGGSARDALNYVERLASEYQRAYYSGIIHERQARALLNRRRPEASAYFGFLNALDWFARAESRRPADNADARRGGTACVGATGAAHLDPPAETGELPLE